MPVKTAFCTRATQACHALQFQEQVLQLTAEACKLIDLQQHRATHPRLGAVDHIVCHPLDHKEHDAQPSCKALSSQDAASCMARALATALAEAQPELPIMLYGSASADAVRLQDVRRSCGALLQLLPRHHWRRAMRVHQHAARCCVVQAGHHMRSEAAAGRASVAQHSC